MCSGWDVLFVVLFLLFLLDLPQTLQHLKKHFCCANNGIKNTEVINHLPHPFIHLHSLSVEPQELKETPGDHVQAPCRQWSKQRSSGHTATYTLQPVSDVRPVPPMQESSFHRFNKAKRRHRVIES